MAEPATTISSAVTKALSAIKDFPLWLLTAIALSLIAFLSVPQFSDAVPRETRTWIIVAAVTAAIFAGCRFGSVVIAPVKTQRKLREERIRRAETIRYSTVYILLFAELFRIRITTTYSQRAPKFRDRVKNSWDILSARRRRVAALKPAWTALFDRQVRVAGEVDYGGEFPIDMLRCVVEQNLSTCDHTLLNLISAAEQSHMEIQIGYDQLTQEDIELYDYIMSEHPRLKKVLSR